MTHLNPQKDEGTAMSTKNIAFMTLDGVESLDEEPKQSSSNPSSSENKVHCTKLDDIIACLTNSL